MGKDEAPLGVVVLHGEDPVHADGGPGGQPGDEPFPAGVPEAVAQSPAAIGGPDDEEAHEAEGILVSGDGAPANQLAVNLGGDEGLGVGGPEQVGIMKAGVPALRGGPGDEVADLGTGHLAD